MRCLPRSAIDGLYSIFVSPQLDPVVALHRYQPAGSHATAWTCYSGWKTINRPQPGDPDLVNLLLDRHRQRADLLQVKLDLASHATRRIHHTVAFGLAGCRVGEFPRMASLHLRRSGKKDNEVVLYRPLSVTLKLGKQQQIDDAVQRQYQVDARQSVVRALLREQTIDTQNYWFLVLGWIVPDFLETGRDLDKTKALLQAITDWCRQRLSDDLDKLEQSGHIRVLPVVAVESLDEGLLDDLQETIEELSEQHDDSQMFQIGELDRLEGVKRIDLRHYFDDPQVCNCDDRYRQDFPKLLLGERREMPFDEAVRTIRRGHPSNWGNLYQELQDMSNNNEWPPKTYDPDFWQKRNGR
jgi:hypothetical protein